jgi:hypothetical protein
MRDEMPSPASDLASATRLFLARHGDALASGEGARTLEACEGLLAALGETLPEEIAAVRGAAVPEPASPGLVSLLSPSPREREAWAHASLTRRMAEGEGILLQLQLALRNLESGEGDAFRLVALITAGRTVLRGLEQAMIQWTDAVAALAGAPPEPASPAPAWAGIRAAREALLAGAPDAAAPALRRALRAGLAAPLRLAPFEGAEDALAAWRASGRLLPAGDGDVRALEAALVRGSDDPVVGWALVDAVEGLVNRAAMAGPGSAPPS